MNDYSAGRRSFVLRLFSKIIIISIYIIVGLFLLYLPAFRDRLSDNKSLNVCVFTETFAPEMIEAFTKKTGVKVNLTYVEMDEQMYAKFRMNGALGYDVVNVSDFLVQMLIQDELLYKFEQSKIPNLDSVMPSLRGKVYDPQNHFSVPHKWYVYGFAYKKSFFEKMPQPLSLDLLFADQETFVRNGLISNQYKVSMLEDGRDAVFLASLYKDARVDNLDDPKLEWIKKLLVKQKKWVETYTVSSSEYYLLNDILPLALMSSNYMRKILEQTSDFGFVIPKEGSMLIIENLVIPNTSHKKELAQEFINFMLSDEVAAFNSDAFSFDSANKNAQEHNSPQSVLTPTEEDFKRLHIPLLPAHLRKAVEDLWLEVGFS